MKDARSDSDGHTVLLAEVRQAFGRVAYTHKAHEKECDRQASFDQRIRLAQIVFSSLTSGSLLGYLVVDQAALGAIAGVLSVTGTLLALYTRSFAPGVRSVEHHRTAVSLWAIRERYVSLITDLVSGHIGGQEARAMRNELMEETAAVYSEAPRTSPQSYRRAGLALRTTEVAVFEEVEIDSFLPADLHAKKPGAEE